MSPRSVLLGRYPECRELLERLGERRVAEVIDKVERAVLDDETAVDFPELSDADGDGEFFDDVKFFGGPAPWQGDDER